MVPASKLPAEDRIAIVIEVMKNPKAMGDVCRRYGISQTTFYNWRDKFMEGGRNALVSNGNSSAVHAAEARIAELEQIIGKQAVELQVLKKSLNLR